MSKDTAELKPRLPNGEAEENLEQLAWVYANSSDVPDFAKNAIKELWREVCAREQWFDRLSALQEQNERYKQALEFYANPENYDAIAIMPVGTSCGSFNEDFDEDHGHPDYDRPMPGKLARSALSERKE